VPPAPHRDFAGRVLSRLPTDPRIVGIAVQGSWARDEMDEFSDLDLVVAVAREHHAAVIADAATIAASVGPLLSSFPGDHLGKPGLRICLYGPPLLHVDYSFHPVGEAAGMVGKPAVLWERDGALTRLIRDAAPVPPRPIDPQWIEDRIWVWLHYGGTKAARGEMFEAIDALTFVRGVVLGPMLLTLRGRPPYGVRRVETVAGDDLPALHARAPPLDGAACIAALLAVVDRYRPLRDRLATPALVRRTATEEAVVAWLTALGR
jgi:hypothetical protein